MIKPWLRRDPSVVSGACLYRSFTFFGDRDESPGLWLDFAACGSFQGYGHGQGSGPPSMDQVVYLHRRQTGHFGQLRG
jgi:hypothetical protein